MPTPSELRDELQRLVIADLLGPAGGPDELVHEYYVRDRYLVGRLAPRGARQDPMQTSDAAPAGADGEDGAAEPAAAAVPLLLSSSIGLSFAVAKETPALRLTARWGRYEPLDPELADAADAPPTGGDEARDASGAKGQAPRGPFWRRVPMEGVLASVPLAAGSLEEWAPCPEQPEVTVQGRVRDRGDQWVVTLFLLNGQEEPATRRDRAWLFQPELVVEAADGSPAFSKRVYHADRAGGEEQAMAMLYRRHLEFAVGHGVAVHADPAPGRYDRAIRLSTAVVPVYELPPTLLPDPDNTPALAGLVLDMRALSEVPDGGFGARLAALAEAYAGWIRGLAERVDDPDESLRYYVDCARAYALGPCRRTLERLRAGIALLDADPRAAQAFRFANRAMYLQRVHSLLAEAVRRGQPTDLAALDVPANHSWRVFQLAFMLLNLPALADPTHPERQGDGEGLADLLWFPTGGGKTEAYLGIAAFALGIRRLQGEVGGRSGHAGVTVLMRYTLRLLTLQQFQRAAALICACEVLRREDPVTWGAEPFRIGLWVGRRSTPNWTKDAAVAVRNLRGSAYQGGESNPHQLTNCPWCGRRIDPGADIKVETADRGVGRTLVYCSDAYGRCPFSRQLSPGEGIPALVVDEEIYRRLPSLLIATVDKFAQMPWNGRTAMLFGQVDGYCERHGFRSPEIDDADKHTAKGKLPAARTLPMGPLRPPDLIIQDELHLISGPLGTLVGLYETAVDRLASWEVDGVRVHPKVIASTATIRQAQEQVTNVFLRQLNVFPPHGLDAEDNFFSRQGPPTPEQPGRRYLGLCATGIRQRTANIYVYVAILAAAQKLYEEYGEAADPWMTLVGYFGSLRELGGMRRAVDDTVASRLRRADVWGLAQRWLSYEDVTELTSRLSATDIPEILDRLEAPFVPDLAPVTKGRQGGSTASRRQPIHVLLATNMISVGVDVSRLGLMVVTGQPKATAEYIQATSRVGRRHPGLVATVYSWTRPRDLSHYEQFEHYHDTFYQYVEALSVTPFSPRAIDRGLAAVLVALVRLLRLERNANAGAGQLRRDDELLGLAREQIMARIESLIPRPDARTVSDLLSAKVDHWLSRVDHQRHGVALGYREQGGTVAGLLAAPRAGDWEPFTCLNSLRDVEPSVNLLLDPDGVDEADGRSWLAMPPGQVAGDEEAE